MLRDSKTDRTLAANLMLASSTSTVSGITNIAGLLAFLAFTSNITGHVANLARNIVAHQYREVAVFITWLLMFFLGAFLSSFIIRSFSNKSYYRAHSIPIMLEIAILLFVAVYGNNFYRETQLEREVVLAAMLFAMGLQNSLVNIVSGGIIKSSHLTGLFTDLGGEIAEFVHPRSERTDALKSKIYVRFTILAFYLLGCVAGGLFFNIYGFTIFYFVPLILLTILYFDLSPLALHKITKLFSPAYKR